MGKHINISNNKIVESNSKGKNIFVQLTQEDIDRLRVPGYPLLIK